MNPKSSSGYRRYLSRCSDWGTEAYAETNEEWERHNQMLLDADEEEEEEDYFDAPSILDEDSPF